MPWHQPQTSVLIKRCLLYQCAVVVGGALHLLFKHVSHYSRFSHPLSLCSHNFHCAYTHLICVNTKALTVRVFARTVRYRTFSSGMQLSRSNKLYDPNNYCKNSLFMSTTHMHGTETLQCEF